MMDSINPTMDKNVKGALVECANWIDVHTGDLAKSIAGGALFWRIEFSSGPDGLWPCVSVSADKALAGAINEYWGSEMVSRDTVVQGRFTFERDTMVALGKCSAWLRDNAETLEGQFKSGPSGWSICFGSGADGMFNGVAVLVNGFPADRIEGYANDSPSHCVRDGLPNKMIV